MKIAVIRRVYAAAGGAELYVERLMSALAALGHEIHLYAERWPEKPKTAQLHSVLPGGTRAEQPGRFADAVAAAVARETFDCIFSLERTVRQDVYRAGDGVHAIWLERRKQFAPWWRKPLVAAGKFHRNLLALERRTFSSECTRRIIVNSEMVRHEIVERFHFPSDRIHLVRNGINTSRFRGGDREKIRKRFGIERDEFLILFAGSGWERKGLRFLLAAFESARGRDNSAAKNWKLLVAGKGETVRARNVIFAGPIKEMEDIYAAADVFALLPIYDPSSNACIEAMAAGLPVITSGYNGASELIQPGVNGTIIQHPADAETVSGALHFWHERWQTNAGARLPSPAGLDLERNVSETIDVLAKAAREKAG